MIGLKVEKTENRFSKDIKAIDDIFDTWAQTEKKYDSALQSKLTGVKDEIKAIKKTLHEYDWSIRYYGQLEDQMKRRLAVYMGMCGSQRESAFVSAGLCSLIGLGLTALGLTEQGSDAVINYVGAGICGLGAAYCVLNAFYLGNEYIKAGKKYNQLNAGILPNNAKKG